MNWYNLNSSKKETKAEYLAKIKYRKLVTQQVKGFLEIVGNELIDNVQYRIITNKGFNAISVFEFIQQNEIIEEIHIAVYRMNQKAVTHLKDIISKGNIKGNIIVSKFFRENKKYERWANELVSFSNSSKLINVAFARNHAKVFLAKTKSGKHIVFEGSGNLSDNDRIEQYIYENNREVFEFHKKWIIDVVNNEEEYCKS